MKILTSSLVFLSADFLLFPEGEGSLATHPVPSDYHIKTCRGKRDLLILKKKKNQKLRKASRVDLTVGVGRAEFQTCLQVEQIIYCFH